MKPVTISLQKQLKAIEQTCSACQSLYETGIERSNPAIMYAQVSLLKSLALQVFECARSVKVVRDNFDIFSFMILLNNEDLYEWSEKVNEEQNKIGNYTSIEHSENSIFLQAFEEVWICVRENITELRQPLSQFNYCANQSSIFDENIVKSIFFRNRVITPLMYFIFVWIGILRNLLQETGVISKSKTRIFS